MNKSILASLDIELINSLNFDQRPMGIIDTIVLHYTGMQSTRQAIERLCSRQAKVSAHYLIKENGQIIQLVDPYNRAWHAGVSYWRGRDKLNDHSIGIEIINSGHEFGYHHFSDLQINSLIILCQELIKIFSIQPVNIVAHSDIAPDRKQDPGELFDWAKLAKYNIGVYPPSCLQFSLPSKIIFRLHQQDEELVKLRMKLQNIGYKLSQNFIFDQQLESVIIAFKRRFDQHNLTPWWDDKSANILDYLLIYY